ncbi:SseB family protein [Thalassococcus sp. CAU 1522]|uniref:SseB family protein n=1 Tax=Thalassococcus arenae TaxID=2851652 RepID=A0ABS6N526_9RHOB|nr:SseB family protein [Thalassococcus arenae]MBV2359107.1 SseB family protein [Thalassococcus arenae]
MTDDTALDRAFAAADATPDDDAARLRFYERLADSELFLMLAREADGDAVEPAVFSLSDGPVVLAFDREDRLAQFAGGIVPYAALSGRIVMRLLAGQGLGLGINLDVAPSATLLPAQAIDWLAETLDHGPDETEATIEEVSAPTGLPERLLAALDAKLALAAGLAGSAWLAKVRYAGGTQGHLLGFAAAVPGAEPSLARAVNEALVFSGLDAGALDVVFLRTSDPLSASLARVGLRFDLPEPPQDRVFRPAAPGMDPDRPPKLK